MEENVLLFTYLTVAVLSTPTFYKFLKGVDGDHNFIIILKVVP